MSMFVKLPVHTQRTALDKLFSPWRELGKIHKNNRPESKNVKA